MKSIRSIVILFVVVIAIIMFWLAPGINKANNVEYVRRYEDTDRRAEAKVNSDTTLSKKTSKKQEAKAIREMQKKKVYKEERISARDKWSTITPKKFSRAVHFEEMVSKVVEDTVTQLADTTKIIQ